MITFHLKATNPDLERDVEVHGTYLTEAIDRARVLLTEGYRVEIWSETIE